MWRHGRCRSPNGRNNAAAQSVRAVLRLQYPLGEPPENPVSRSFQRRDVLRGDGCRRGFSGTAVDKHLPAAETRVHHTPPDAPANTLPHQLFDDGALRVREHIRRPVENPEPEREALGIGQSVVPELNLGSVLVKRPVVLNALAVGDDDLLGDLIPDLGDERLVVRQQPAHQVVPSQPYLVLPGAAEARTLEIRSPAPVPDRKVRRGSSAESRRVSWEPRSPRATSSATTVSSHTSRQAPCAAGRRYARRHATPTQGRHKVSPGRTSASGAATAATAPSSGRRSRCRTRIRPHRKARAGAAPRRPEGGPTCRAGAAARRSPSRNRNNGRNVRSPPRPGHRTSPTHRQRLASHGRADRPGRRGPSSKKAGRPERPYVNHS